MSKKLRVSKEYGLNPSVQLCPCCGKEMGVVLFGTSYKDKKGKTAEAPRQIALPGQLCDSCKDVIENKNGTFFVEIRDGETGDNPYRTGRLVAIPRKKAEEMFGEVHSIQYMHASLFEQVFGDALKEQQKSEQ